MPQSSLFKEMELHKVVVTLAVDEVLQSIHVQVLATNRAGALLASAGLNCASMDESDLLPALLSEVAYGFLYRGAHEAVTIPVRGFKSRRKDLGHW
jgi:hypothetical protein